MSSAKTVDNAVFQEASMSGSQIRSQSPRQVSEPSAEQQKLQGSGVGRESKSVSPEQRERRGAISSAQVFHETTLREASPALKANLKGTPIDLKNISFDPKSPELTTSWFTGRANIVALNVYPNGLTLSVHRNPEVEPADDEELLEERKVEERKGFLPTQFHLRLKDTREYMVPQGKYHLIREKIGETLERHLHQLREQEILQNAVLYFGMATDPFYAFPKKFEVTMKCVELLERYQPGMLVLQSRSPMILSALPMLKHFGSKGVAVIPIETPNERVIQQFTPGQASAADRISAADGLRKQGIKVNLQVSPVLPYGDFYRDAWPFAEFLAEHADYITLGCLATGSVADEPTLKNLPMARQLSAEKQYRWLRPHAYRYLFHALQTIAPEKLLLPVKPEIKQSQLSLFAA